MTTSNGLHILVATDGSAHTADVSDFLRQFLPPNGVSHVTILSVINDVPVYPAFCNDGYMFESAALEMAQWEQIRSSARSDAQAATRALEQALVDRVGTVTRRVEEGRPGETIVRAAVDSDADLIVVGSHDHGLLYSAVFGNVSEYVLHHAHRPVLIVPWVAAVPAHTPERADQRASALTGQPMEGLASSTV